MSGGKHTVILKGRGLRKEALAGGTIQPGDLITRNSSGAFIRHATAKEQTVKLFAVENELFGKGIDTNYASGDNVLAEAVQGGAEVQCNIAAAAAAIVIGDLLESAGDGTLRKLTPESQSGTTPFAVTTEGFAIARALEAVDNSGGASIVQLIVEVL